MAKQETEINPNEKWGTQLLYDYRNNEAELMIAETVVARYEPVNYIESRITHPVDVDIYNEGGDKFLDINLLRKMNGAFGSIATVGDMVEVDTMLKADYDGYSLVLEDVKIPNIVYDYITRHRGEYTMEGTYAVGMRPTDYAKEQVI